MINKIKLIRFILLILSKKIGRLNFYRNFTICNSQRTGFTLIELIVVLFIIGIASGLVGILITKKTGNLELRTFTKEMSATLRYARSHAVSEKKVYSFIIHKTDRIYGLYTDISGDEEPVSVISKPIPDSLQITFNGNEADSLRIDFSPQGSSTGGVIEIKSQKGTFFFIIINRVSGKVEVKKN